MTEPSAISMLPRRVVARKLAARGQVLSGSVATAELHRLAATVLATEAVVEVDLAFAPGDAVAEIHGHMRVGVILTCERCLEPVEIALAAAPALGLVRSDEDAAQLPARLEPCFVPAEELDLFDLVEEELLLALPIVARHQEACGWLGSLDPVAPETAESPFRVLERLKPQR